MSSWNALQFLIDYNIPYWTEGNNVQNGWVNIQCPFCDDTSNHGGFNVSCGYYNCWRCGFAKIKRVVYVLLGCSLQEAHSICTEYSGSYFITARLNKKQPRAKKIELPGKGMFPIEKRYLKKRGFDPEKMSKKYGVQGGIMCGEWAYRIIIPIFYGHQLIAFQGRTINPNDSLRYKNLGIENCVIHYKDIFYNLDNCRKESICIVEGVPDVWRFGNNFAASFGTSVTTKQIKKLRKYKNIFIMFDPEKTAQKQAKKLGFQLSSLGKSVELILLDGEKDPAERGIKEVRKIKRELGL